MKRAAFLLFSVFLSTALFAQNVTTGGKESLKIQGFLSASFFAQNQQFAFGNGQNAEWAASNNTQNQWLYGGDIRNTRLTMVFNGPEVTNDWKLGGVLELDAFNDPTNTGPFGGQIWTPRVRLAYADLVHENMTIRFGQAWDPLFGNVPVSLSHIAFPLGYGSAGDIGWRFPGIFFYYKFDSNSSTHVSLDAAVMAGSWYGPGSTTNSATAGNAGTPQFELRLNVENKFSDGGVFKAYVVGHYDEVNLAGIGAADSLKNNLTGTAGELGASFNSSGFLVQGNVYTGKNIGHQFGDLTQFRVGNNLLSMDLSSTGGWAQAGYAFESGWGIYGFYGTESVNEDDLVTLLKAAGTNVSGNRYKNNLYDIMVRYETGPFEIGVEYLHSQLTYLTFPLGVTTENTQNGTQIALSTLYHF
jgi:hypothetical protein